MQDLEREYSLYEIAIITRAGPARMLGLPHKGHLGVGADADVTIYTPRADSKAMFELPRFVIKAGEIIVEQGEIRRDLFAVNRAACRRAPCKETDTAAWRRRAVPALRPRLS